jgi:hypothetical protein
MRHFHSYGPVDPQEHYCVPRRELVARCADQLIGNPSKGGHYFTIWAPRQTGKTWLMRQAMAEVRARHGDRFQVAQLSMQDVQLKDSDPAEAFLQKVPHLLRVWLNLTLPAPADFAGFGDLFRRGTSPFDRPLILLIDEFDSLPTAAIDALGREFRALYLNRDASLLHGLALVGVRAVLGVDSPRGSPFNVQRSLHVPNLSAEEVNDMFDQYRGESGQTVTPEVVSTVYEMTRGQPGLVGWFGELLTEKYNPGPPRRIDVPALLGRYGRSWPACARRGRTRPASCRARTPWP